MDENRSSHWKLAQWWRTGLTMLAVTMLAVTMLAVTMPCCGGKVVFDDSARGGAGSETNRGGGAAASRGGGGGRGGGPLSAGGCGGGLAWALTFGSEGEDRVEELADAGGGRTVVVGGIHGVVHVGAATMISAGGMDAYVLVLDANGDVVWTRVFGDGVDQLATSVAVDAAGTIYVAGSAEGVVDFGGGPQPSAGAADVFVVALTSDGDTLWSQMFGGPQRDVGEDVAVSPSGGIFLGGSLAWSVQVGDDFLIHSGGDDAFLAKLSAGGKPEWAKLFGGSGQQGIRAVASDSLGNVVVTGETSESISFGGPSLPFDDQADAFVAKLDPNGLHLWSTAFTGPGFQEGYGVATDEQDAVVTTGLYEGAVSFGGEPVESEGARDIYLVKLDAAGQHLWSRSFGDSSIQSVRHVATSSDDSILLTGPASAGVDFGCGQAGGEPGSPKAAVSKFDSAGALTFGVLYDDGDENNPIQHQYAKAAVGDGGDLVVGGHFFGSISFGVETSLSQGDRDCFVAKHVGVP